MCSRYNLTSPPEAVRAYKVLGHDHLGEIRLAANRIEANGVCHSDLWAIEHGNWGAPFPMLLGHEAVML